MQQTSGCEIVTPEITTSEVESPASGARRRSPSQCLLGIRRLARSADWLSLEELAFELFFAAARIESTGDVSLVREQLEEIAACVPEVEARFYRRAVRILSRAVPV